MIAVHGRSYIARLFFFFLEGEMHLQQLFITNFCFLHFILNICVLGLLRFSKTWLSEIVPILSRHALLLLEHFLFYFSDFIFLYDYIFWLSLSLFSLLSLLQLLLLFLILLFPLVWFYHSILYLCINQIFLDFKHMTRQNIVQS